MPPLQTIAESCENQGVISTSENQGVKQGLIFASENSGMI
jgi:hypothetical protein